MQGKIYDVVGTLVKTEEIKMQGKIYDVVGIGHAIVDLLAHIDDDFLTEHNLDKGVMRLVDENEANRIHRAINVKEEKSGGSCANTIAGLASLNSRVSFIGKVKNDPMGNSFEEDMTKEGVFCSTKKSEDGLSTGKCVILVTPDAQRTMNTYIGIACHLSPDDVDDSVIEQSKVAYLEGYLWDHEAAKKAYLKTVDIAHKSGGKVALSLSDPFCVNRHRKAFLDLIKNHVDILFSNEEEVKQIFEESSFENAIRNLRALKIQSAVTRAEKGSVVVCSDGAYEIPAESVASVVDTTGAGDIFAAGFLHGYTLGNDPETCGRMGNIAAAEIISHFGARPKKSLAKVISEKCA